MDFLTHFVSLNADQTWIQVYLDFLASADSPQGRSHRHHILPRALFREFASFKLYPLNCKRLTPSDHFVAHYYLYRALPKHPLAYLSFLKMATVTRLHTLIQNNYDENLVRDMSLEYERIRSGMATLDGWVHIYSGKLHTVALVKYLPKMLKEGWTQQSPPRQWVHKGEESLRIPVEHTQRYLEQGFILGRPTFHTVESRKLTSDKAVLWHKQKRLNPEAYSYMPHAQNHWAYGEERDQETKAKISKTLTGRPLSPEHAAKVKVATTGMHWQWTEDACQKRSDSMKGVIPTKGFTMAGKSHSEETRDLMSESHKEFYLNNPEGVANLDAARPRGEQHVFFGKERDAETRAKIAKSLEGKKQSEETKQKRAASLALSKMPEYTMEEIATFHSLWATPDLKSFCKLAKTLKRSPAKTVAAGLKIMKFYTADETNYRYWRQADAWKRLSTLEE